MRDAHTPTRLPYIGGVEGRPGLTVCAGGNGYAAKSSDELGRIAAASALGVAEGCVTEFTPVFDT